MMTPVVTGPFALGEALAEREQATLLRRRTPGGVANGGRTRVGARE